MASKEKFADKMEFPPEIQQPNIYPLSWNVKTKKLQEVWEASLRENWDPEKLPWDTLDVDSYTGKSANPSPTGGACSRCSTPPRRRFLPKR
jgi:hypothetical protein